MIKDKKHCVIFDGDGVVMDDAMFSEEYQRRSGISKEEMLPFYTGVFQDCLIGKADLKEAIKPWLEKWNFSGTSEDFLHDWFEYENLPMNETLNFISELKSHGVLCCLATNQEKYRTAYVMNEMNFKNYFDIVYSSAEIGYKKPQAEYYQFVIKDLAQRGISLENIIYIDDSPANVSAAESFGIKSFVFTSVENMKQDSLLSHN